MIRVFQHYISGIYFGLTILEFCVNLSALFVGSKLRDGVLSLGFGSLFWASVLYAVMMLLATSGMGGYQRFQAINQTGLYVRVISAFIITLVGMSLFFYAFPSHAMGRGAFACAIVYSMLTVLLIRLMFYRIVKQQLLRRRVLVLGAGVCAQRVLELESSCPRCDVEFVGCIPINEEKRVVSPSKIVDLKQPLHEYALANDIDDIVVAPDDRRKGLPVDEILDCKMSGFAVLDLVTFFEREAGLIRVDSLHPSWFLFSDGFHIATTVIAKRFLDIAASLILLVLLWPLMVITGFAIWVESGGKGPIFYSQTRVGVNWSLFRVRKFRSMRPNAESGRPIMARKRDDRITPVGVILRKYRIDELPQLYNVLIGEMSFVGPRPERPEFVEKYAASIPYYSERHRVKPGITGWAQLCYPYGSTKSDAIQKLQYDLYYIKNYSFFLDLVILIQTIETVLWGKGAR